MADYSAYVVPRPNLANHRPSPHDAQHFAIVASDVADHHVWRSVIASGFRQHHFQRRIGVNRTGSVFMDNGDDAMITDELGPLLDSEQAYIEGIEAELAAIGENLTDKALQYLRMGFRTKGLIDIALQRAKTSPQKDAIT